MRIAQEFSGEIIAADSRTIYQEMDIGTAKPTAEDRERVAHWGLDIVRPGDTFTAADFKKYASEKVAEVRSRGHVPILVGGTGLYIDGLLFDYQFGMPDPTLREKLERLSLDELKAYCYTHNIDLPENHNNRRYVMRAIEQGSVNTNRGTEPLPNTIIVGITTEKSILRQRIEQRAEQLFETGMVEEAKILGEKYGWNSEAMTGNIYRLVRRFLDGEFDEAELQQRFVTSDWQLAKRQLTWLKRNPFIHWKTLEEAYDFIVGELKGEKVRH
jgi:tRNA dimethylallyltransferase